MLDLDLHLQRGDFRLNVTCKLDAPTTGIFGASGAGKTTVLNAIAGLVRPQRGRIVVDEEVLFDSERRIWVPVHKRRIGVVFQDNRLFPHYSVRKNLVYGRGRARPSAPLSSVDNVIEILELQELMTRSPQNLSGGEKRRVALGRALLQSPRLLLLDEPLAGIDKHRCGQLLPFLRRVQAETQIPILLVSHELSEILHLTDSMLILDHGLPIASGKYCDLLQQPRPLELMSEAGLLNIVSLQVKEHRPDEGMTLLTPRPQTAKTGQRFFVKAPCLENRTQGSVVDAIFRPEDIALARTPIGQISVQNQLRGEVQEILCTVDKTLCLVDVGFPLLVDVTRQAIAELGLVPGAPVWCLFKAHAVRCVATDDEGIRNRGCRLNSGLERRGGNVKMGRVSIKVK